MVVEEALQRIQSLYSKGVQSKDSRLMDRHIYKVLITARSAVISRMHDQKQEVSNYMYQTLPCVQMQNVSSIECECSPIEAKKIKRSAKRIPKPISTKTGLIFSVTNSDGTEEYDETTFKNYKYEGGNKYTSSKKRFYIKNGYLYLINTSLLSNGIISLTGLFEDPIEVANFPSACDDVREEDCGCFDLMKADFPTDERLMRETLTLANDELIRLFSQMREDKRPNASDDNISTGSMIH